MHGTRIPSAVLASSYAPVVAAVAVDIAVTVTVDFTVTVTVAVAIAAVSVVAFVSHAQEGRSSSNCTEDGIIEEGKVGSGSCLSNDRSRSWGQRPIALYR